MKKKYSFEDYNDNNVLKVSWPLKLVLLYAIKPYIPGLIPAVGNMMGGIGKILMDLVPTATKDFAYQYFIPHLLWTCLPALVLVIVALKRNLPKAPQAGRFVRWSWKNGRELLMSVFILEMAMILVYLVAGLKQLDGVFLMVLYLDAMAIFFLVKSQRVREIFAEFPLPDDQAWLLAGQENTILSYQMYLSSNAVKNHAEEAYMKMDELAWEQATTEDTAESYQRYVDANISAKRHAFEARQRMAELVGERLQEEG
jgi:hypothetical protein